VSRTRLFCRQYQTTFQQPRNGRFSPNSATTRESWVKRRIRTEIYEKVSIQGSFAPKTRNFEGVKQVPHSEQATGLQVTGYTAERYCLFHVVVQGPGSLRYRSLGFPTRFLPKPKNRVTRSFFKTEKPVFGCL